MPFNPPVEGEALAPVEREGALVGGVDRQHEGAGALLSNGIHQLPAVALPLVARMHAQLEQVPDVAVLAYQGVAHQHVFLLRKQQEALPRQQQVVEGFFIEGVVAEGCLLQGKHLVDVGSQTGGNDGH